MTLTATATRKKTAKKAEEALGKEAAGVGVLRWEMGLVEVGVEPRERRRKIRWCFARC